MSNKGNNSIETYKSSIEQIKNSIKELFEEHKNKVTLPNSFKTDDIQKYKKNIENINNKGNANIIKLKADVLLKIEKIQEIYNKMIKKILIIMHKKIIKNINNNKNKIKFNNNKNENNNNIYS
jgi:hypothetical protein